MTAVRITILRKDEDTGRLIWSHRDLDANMQSMLQAALAIGQGYMTDDAPAIAEFAQWLSQHINVEPKL